MINILIVDDQFLTRQALRVLIEKDPNLTIVDEAANGIKALELMNRKAIDIAIVDLDMPKMNGFEFTEKVSRDFPQTKIIILSGSSDRESIERAIDCGARGYLIKDTSISEAIDTIYYVQRGYFQLGPGLLEKLIARANYDGVQTSQHLSVTENRSKPDFSFLQQEIQQELSAELDTKITEFKFEVKTGLNTFQDRVIQQLKYGLENQTSYYNPFQSTSKLREHLEGYTLEKIHLMEDKYTKIISKISQEIGVLRYCILFFIVFFVIEHLFILF